jgi:hypothetical protein
MRVTFRIFGLCLFIAFSGLFTACHQSSDDNSINPTNFTTPATGKWKVSYFWDKKDETSHFSSYTFDFSSNGNLTITNGSQTFTGNCGPDNDDSKSKFIFTFNGSVPSELSDLAEDWLIIEMQDDFMHFEHTSGGNGDTDVLKFEKI